MNQITQEDQQVMVSRPKVGQLSTPLDADIGCGDDKCSINLPVVDILTGASVSEQGAAKLGRRGPVTGTGALSQSLISVTAKAFSRV